MNNNPYETLITCLARVYPNDTGECHCKHTNKYSQRGCPNGVHNNIKKSIQGEFNVNKKNNNKLNKINTLHAWGRRGIRLKAALYA
jgi:hypothetical protein